MQPNQSKHTIHLDTPWGVKQLFTAPDGSGSFFTIAPDSSWIPLEFDALEKAQQFIGRYFDSFQGIHICSSL